MDQEKIIYFKREVADKWSRQIKQKKKKHVGCQNLIEKLGRNVSQNA